MFKISWEVKDEDGCISLLNTGFSPPLSVNDTCKYTYKIAYACSSYYLWLHILYYPYICIVHIWSSPTVYL